MTFNVLKDTAIGLQTDDAGNWEKALFLLLFHSLALRSIRFVFRNYCAQLAYRIVPRAVGLNGQTEI